MGPFEDILTSNIISTYHAYEAAKRSGVKRFVLASTNHVQHGSSKAVDGGPGSIDASRLGGRQMTLSDPPTPDSYYAASKLLNEDMGKLYSRIWNNFEVVSLRIGWVLYDDPTELKDTEFENYLRAMFLSRGLHWFLQSVVVRASAPGGRRLRVRVRPEQQ